MLTAAREESGHSVHGTKTTSSKVEFVSLFFVDGQRDM